MHVAILILDGMYNYIHPQIGKLVFSSHKHRSLVIPVMVVGTDGYIPSVFGPNLALVRIMILLFQTTSNNVDEIKYWLEKDDLVVVDRWLRDSIYRLLEKVGLKMCLSHGCKQHTTEETNHSRCIIKVRLVVESTNGRIDGLEIGKWQVIWVVESANGRLDGL